MDVVFCGEEAQAQALREALAPELAALRERETPAHDYSLIRERARRWGGITEAADQSVAMSVPIDGVVEGRFLPFLTAVEDRVLTPELRYAGYVYSAGTELALSLYACQYTANDVGLANTVALFEALPENIRGLSLTQEALDGYTQMSYGMQTVPMGPLTLAEMAAWVDMRGYDAQALRETIADMRNARVEDQEEAAQAFARAMEDAALVVLGTESSLRKTRSSSTRSWTCATDAGRRTRRTPRKRGRARFGCGRAAWTGSCRRRGLRRRRVCFYTVLRAGLLPCGFSRRKRFPR